MDYLDPKDNFEQQNSKVSSDLSTLVPSNDLQTVLKKKALKASFEGGVLLNNLNLNSQLIDTESVLEFLVLSFCKSFKITPKISAGLLAQNSSFLGQLIRKGLKRDFEPVLYWYELMNSFAEHLISLIDKEKKSFKVVLNCLKSGLSSVSDKVNSKCISVMRNIHKLLKKYEKECFEWFIKGSDTLINCFKLIEKNLVVSDIVELVLKYTKDDYLLVFGEKLREYCQKPIKYLDFIQNISSSFMQLNLVNKIFDCGLAKHWIDLCLNTENADQKNSSIRAQCLSFLCDIWTLFWKFFEAQESLSNSILTFIKRIIREGSRNFKILTFGRLFEIFSNFTQQKITYAPILYKTLIFCLVENYHDERLREFIFVNFNRILTEDLSIPLSILIEPLVKQALILKHISFHIFDFDFYISIGRHPQLSLKDAILIIDLCGKVLTSDSVYCKTAEIPVMIISARFIDQKPYQDYLVRFFSFVIKMRVNPAIRPDDFEATGRVLIFQERIVRFNQFDLNERLKDLLKAYIVESRKVKDKAIDSLYRTLFEPFSNNILQLKEIPQKSDSFAVYSLNSIPPNRVMMEIDKIKQRRLYRENKERIESQNKSLHYIVQKKALKNEIKKRRIELGINSKLNEDDNMIILNNGSLKDTNYNFTKIQQEPSETRKMILSVVRRFSKVNRVLFSKYSGSTYKNKGSITPTFEKYQKGKEALCESDFSLFLRDFSLLNTRITVEEMKRIFLEVMKKSQSFLSLEDFSDLLYMTARLIAFKEPLLYAKFPEAIQLQMLYGYLKEHTDSTIPRHFFTDPDCGYGDRDIVRSLNEKLQKDPKTLLPDNYKKYEETILVVKYEPPIGKKSQRIAISLIDNLLSSIFGFHFLMPIIETHVKIRAKGILKQEDPDDITPQYLKKIESNPGFGKLSAHLKIHAIQMNFTEELILECTKLMDDLIFSVEKSSYTLISRFPKPAGTLTNRVTQEKQLMEIERHYQSERIEEKRKARAKRVGEEAEKIKLDKEYKDYLKREEDKKRAIEMKYRERKEKKDWERKKFEIDEKILEYKLSKIEQQMGGMNSLNSLPRVRKDDIKVNRSVDYKRHEIRDKKVDKVHLDRKTGGSVPKVFDRFFKRN